METKTYDLTLTKIKQLVDLNQDYVNYDITFHVSVPENKEFEIVVVNQQQLDEDKPLEYQKASGTISGNIVSKNNIQENYSMLLRSEEATPANIVVETTRLPDFIPIENEPKVEKETPSRWSGWKIRSYIPLILAIVVILIIVFRVLQSESYTESPSTQPNSSLLEKFKSLSLK